MKLQQSIVITRPVSEVFEYRCHLQNVMEWQRDVVAVDLLLPEVPQVGVTAIEHRRGLKGNPEPWELQVTEFEQDQVLGIVGSFGTTRVHERHLFAADDGNTRYTLCVEVTGSAIPASAVHRKTVETLIHFKWQLEAPRVRTRAGRVNADSVASGAPRST